MSTNEHDEQSRDEISKPGEAIDPGVPDDADQMAEDDESHASDALNHCETEKKEYLEGWQRAKADHVNYKKDEAKRFEDMARFVVTGFIEELIPILDSFDLANLQHFPKEVEKGILMIRAQYDDILRKRGLHEIPVQVGDTFNPERHESIGLVASDREEGKVAEIVQRGYMFRERVLRPARVRISSGNSHA